MGVYLNNAATSYPKPECVRRAVARALEDPPSEPGRTDGDHDGLELCRREIAALFAVANPRHVVLLPSATYALNMVVSGILIPGSHAVVTLLEHNSVLRPLAHAARDRGVAVTRLSPEPSGRINPAVLRAAFRSNTRLAVLTHAANVTGAIQPVEEAAAFAAQAGLPLLIDAAQSAGCLPLDHSRLPGRVFIAFSGHKGLLGPSGTGGLIVPDDSLPHWIVGGTGVKSEGTMHPGDLPLRYEAGTPNLPGLAGLAAGVRWVREQGVERLGRHRSGLVQALRSGLAGMMDIEVAPLPDRDGRAGIVSFVRTGWTPEELGFVLRNAFDIDIRAGLHCAPLAHAFLGTAPLGSIRVGFGPFNSSEDVERLLEALARTVRN